MGWVAPSVLYVRFLESLPVPLGIRFAFHLRRMLENQTGVRYFADLTELELFDRRATAAMRELIMVHRHRIASMDIAIAGRVMELVVSNFASAFGGGTVQVVTNTEFRSRLLRAAPRFEEALDARTWRSIPPASTVPPTR